MATSSETPSASYLSATADDRFLFVSNESADTISVINLALAKQSNYAAQTLVGNIATGRAPIAVTLSPDDRYLYTTSEVAANQGSGWPATCNAEQPSNRNGKLHAQGMVMVVDVGRAKTDPANSVIAKVPAGCSPVRLALSPEGDKAYVTARGDDVLLVFDTAKLLSDPAHSKIASVAVGRSPVGVALVDNGRKAVVANSNRFSNDKQKQTLSVIDVSAAAPVVSGNIPAELFPREIRITPDKLTLLVTNFASKTLELIDLTRLTPNQTY
jgi:DNA-binding beta-propeller fold protein YncE